jgi:hypothetical protein
MVWFLAACHPEPPSLLPHLDGRWEGWVQTDAGGSEASADLRWDDEEEVLTGEIVVQEDEGDRVWTLLEGNSVEAFGITLLGVEQGGVRQLQVDALAGEDPDDPLNPLVASWRTKWFCAGEPDGYCHEDGGMQLERR